MQCCTVITTYCHRNFAAKLPMRVKKCTAAVLFINLKIVHLYVPTYKETFVIATHLSVRQAVCLSHPGL